MAIINYCGEISLGINHTNKIFFQLTLQIET
jgi:hypothetical protein